MKNSLIERVTIEKNRDARGKFCAKTRVAEMQSARCHFGTGVAGENRRNKERVTLGMKQTVNGKSQKAQWTRKVREGMEHRLLAGLEK